MNDGVLFFHSSLGRDQMLRVFLSLFIKVMEVSAEAICSLVYVPNFALFLTSKPT